MNEKLKQKYGIGFTTVLDSVGNKIDISERIYKAYSDGATENGIQWHDLRKDPNDLPKRDKDFTVEVTIPVMTHPFYVFATYYFDNKKWFSYGEEIKVIAWCEIPQFKE